MFSPPDALLWTEGQNEGDPNDLRLFLEDICCELCRFQETATAGVEAESVRIDREVRLGSPISFADIRVSCGSSLPYFVEVKYGYTASAIVRHLERKYGAGSGAPPASKIVLVADTHRHPDWPGLEAEVRRVVSIPVEVWDEAHLLRQVADRFGVHIDSVSAANLLELRAEIDRAKGFLAFGAPSLAEYQHDPLRATLTWHFSFWRLRQLREQYRMPVRDMLRPGRYRGVVVLLADLCSFSSFVRDTSDPQVVLRMLTSFYTKARYLVVNRGGFLSGFVGDEVVSMFGIPDRRTGFIDDALETARGLLDIGASIAYDWQRNIDRVQTSGGVHIGMAIGDLEVFPQRPFSRTHMASVGDAINMASRLMGLAGPGEIVMSNLLRQEVGEVSALAFEELAPFEAKNIGRIKAWKCRTPGTE